MKAILKKLLDSVKGAVDVTGVVVDVVLVTALIPIIVTFINNAEGNLSATEFTLLSLTTLFIVLGLVFNIVKQSGVMKKR